MASTTTYPPEAIGAAIAALKKAGISNPIMQSAILSTIAKETSFQLKPETSYAKTSVARIRDVFKGNKKIAALKDNELEKIKTNAPAFFELIYGGRYGNDNPGDGYKYRGRGFNQITFKGNYEAVGKIIGVDLVNYPDKLNEIPVAAAAAAAYFIMFFKTGKTSGKLKEKLGVNDISEIRDHQTAVKATIMANAGWNTDFATPVVQEGYKKALASVQEFSKILTNSVASAAKTINENKGTATALLFFLGLQQQLTYIVSQL